MSWDDKSSGPDEDTSEKETSEKPAKPATKKQKSSGKPKKKRNPGKQPGAKGYGRQVKMAVTEVKTPRKNVRFAGRDWEQTRHLRRAREYTCWTWK